MSFRTATDATYIAQLLGRMIRTPLQNRVKVDDSLNEVRLFLPYFDMQTVGSVIDELKSSECGDIPVEVEGEATGESIRVPWSIYPRRATVADDPNQGAFTFTYGTASDETTGGETSADDATDGSQTVAEFVEPFPQQVPDAPPPLPTRHQNAPLRSPRKN